ncbi:MAG: hypothetical protein JW999_04190 [Methanotrichaceae archaeon]|nr:hypothetical protein [Methanotrichaceae archaeon]
MHKKKILILLFMLSALLVATVEAQLNANEKQEILAAQNRYRAEVNVTALKWSENLSLQAQECADYNAANFLPQGKQKHCPKSGFGQNIALATSSLHRTLTQMVDQWGEEKRNFINGEYPSVSATGSPGAVSHYTQIIWQETAEVGCGKANSSGYEILVCDYRSQGNINGTAVYPPPRPGAVEVSATNQYKTLTNTSAKMPKRNIIINTVFNRPVFCY